MEVSGPKGIIDKVEKFLGGLKFAVIIILLFAVYSTVGTFVESFHGAEYAQRHIYKSWGFMLVQFAIFISVFMAALLRFPMKKRLYGFYTIHLGIIVLLMGSFITYYAGVDATVNLKPNTPTQTLIFSEDVLEMKWQNSGKRVTYDLPAVAGAVDLNAEYDNLRLKTYLPYAQNKFVWKEAKTLLPRAKDFPYHSATYFIQNNFIGEEFTLSLHPESSDFSSSTTMGPLNSHLLPAPMYDCIDQAPKLGYLLWNRTANNCQSVEALGIEVHKTKSGKNFFAFKDEGQVFTFIPDVTSAALDKDLQEIPNSPFRVLNMEMFAKGRHLLLFGEAMALKDEGTWTKQPLQLNKRVELPFMGFNLTLKNYETQKVPTMVPEYVKPIQEGGKTVVGDLRALKIDHNAKKVWIKNDKPGIIQTPSDTIKLDLTKKTRRLPFQLTLKQFKMNKDPGTNTPASYESFVSVFDSEKTNDHHIFMNNPLKYRGFTFYQASYFQLAKDVYGSVLSVNYDPGRPIKYLGSLLLVLGSIWHYFIRKKKKAL